MTDLKKMPNCGLITLLLVSAPLFAQQPSLPVDLQALKDAARSAQGGVGGAPDATPSGGLQAAPIPAAVQAVQEAESARLEKQIQELKKAEGGPRRFASDLFDLRESFPQGTEGGIADDYVLGIGDKLQLSVFGSATFEVPAQVDGRGEVVIPKVGAIKVAGMSLGRARAAVQSKVAQNFSRSTVDMTVTELREVRVFVMGEVYKPGSYLVPSLSSLVNVLSLAGGPRQSGSFRQIRVVRGGKVLHTLDLYPLRAEGKGNMNFSLQSGDVVFVPLAGDRVSLEGAFVRVMAKDPDLSVSEIKKEQQKTTVMVGGAKDSAEKKVDESTPLMQFEALPGENLKELVAYAGGLLPQAYGTSVALRRQDQDGLTTVQDIPVQNLGSVKAQYGDVISAFPRRDRVTRTVSVIGWTRVPGAFARPDGLRVADLLKRENQVLPDTYLGRGEVVRTMEDGSTRFLAFDVTKALAGDPAHNLMLADRDRVELFSVQRMRLPKKVSIEGPLTLPGEFDLHEGMRVSDLVFRAGIPQKSANRFYAELARTTDGKVSEVLKLDLGKLLSTESGSPVALQDEALNPKLREDDRVSVYEKPEFRLHRSVRIIGQVARPGSYVFDSERPTLSSLVERAGGLTSEAMPQAAVMLRQLVTLGAVGGAVVDPLAGRQQGFSGVAEIQDRMSETKMLMDQSTPTAGTMPVPKLFKPPILHGLDLEKMNRLVVDFKRALAKDKDADVELQDGDAIVVPRRTDSVMILGETATPFAFYKVTPGMSVSDLLSLAGGTTRNADTWNIRLLKADGRIMDSWVGRRKLEPGDAVIVPQRIKRETVWQDNLNALTPLALLINAIK